MGKSASKEQNRTASSDQTPAIDSDDQAYASEDANAKRVSLPAVEGSIEPEITGVEAEENNESIPTEENKDLDVVLEEATETVTPPPEVIDPPPTVIADTCDIPEAVAESFTQTDMNTILKTMTLHMLLYDDEIFDFYPIVDTEAEFKAFLAKNLTNGEGEQYLYRDGWCQPYGLYVANENNLTIQFASSGPDKTFGTSDDIIRVWDGIY